MRKWLIKLFETLGVKRKVAGFLAALGPILKNNSELAFLIPYADWIAGAFGLAGIGHAAAGKTLLDAPAATLSSIFSVLLLLTYLVPALAEYQEVVRLIAATFGVTIVLNSKSKIEAEAELHTELRKFNTTLR